MRFLILNSYTAEGRQELADFGCTDPVELYRRMLTRIVPDAECVGLCPSDDGADLPASSLNDFDGAAWTGSSLTIHKPGIAEERQIALCRALFEAGVPQFGSCWAVQLAAVSAGGSCIANPRGREAGLARKIYQTDAGREHPIYIDKAPVFDAFTNHNDEVEHLPNDAVLLASNSFTRVQAADIGYANGRFWAPQYHPEYNLFEIARLTDCRRGILLKQNRFTSDENADQFIADLDALHVDPNRLDLSWKLGIDEDVLDEDIRCQEVVNWIEHMVKPAISAR